MKVNKRSFRALAFILRVFAAILFVLGAVLEVYLGGNMPGSEMEKKFSKRYMSHRCVGRRSRACIYICNRGKRVN